MELFKSLAKLALVGGIVYLTVKGEMDRLPSLADEEVQAIVIYILKIIFKIFIRVSIAMILLAALDFVFQKWQHEEQLKMTKQEVKQERKDTDGSPEVKSRVRRIQILGVFPFLEKDVDGRYNQKRHTNAYQHS